MGFKISSNHENPLDILLTRLASTLNPVFRATGHSPNLITTYSFIAGLLAVYFLYQGHIVLFSVLFFVSYFFDCCDGSFARQYHLESKFGDLYDHITDVVVFSLIVVVVILRYRSVIDWLAILIFGGVLMLTLVHLGCQQRNCSPRNCKGDETLDVLKTLCTDRRHIAWTRYFGTGTFIVVIILLIVYLHYKTL